MSALQETRPFAEAILGAVRRPLKVGLLSPHNPYDRTTFSGTAHHMAEALRQRSEVNLRVLGPHRPARAGDRVLRRLIPARPIEVDRLDLSGLDLVIGLTATGLLDQLAAVSRVPFVHVTDATPSFLRECYGWEVPPGSDALEERVVARAALTVYSSRYMARRASLEFGIEMGQRLTAIPFGANVDTLPGQSPDKPVASPLRLFWVGGDWDRKGGALAVATLDELRARGVDARLTIAGAIPPGLRGHPGVERVGYLDKNNPRDARRLSRLYAEAHVFVLPTRADCTPMVVAEANVHGTPVLITDVGGVGSLMEDGRNGRMMPLAAGPREWAEAVRALTRDPGRYAALCRSSFAHAHGRLTWRAWARDFTALLHQERIETAA
jgi:glycosyltransferase involved in cell wall biosynthesis